MSTPSLPPCSTARRPSSYLQQRESLCGVGLRCQSVQAGGVAEQDSSGAPTRCPARRPRTQAGFTPTLFQASATAFCSALVVPYRRLALATVRPAKAAKVAVRLRFLSRIVSYQICPALTQAFPPSAAATR